MSNSTNALKNKLLATCLSQGDSSISTKVNDISSFDLFEYVDTDELNNWLKDSEITKLAISKFKKPVDLADEINNLKTEQDFLNFCKKNEIKLTKTLQTAFTKSPTDAKAKLMKLTNDTLKSQGNKFLKLFKKAEEKFNETAMWYLYVGAYYFCGKINDKDVIAPLLTYRVKVVLDKIKNIYYLEKMDKEISSNAKLFFILNSCYNLDLDDIVSSELKDFEVIQNKFSLLLEEDQRKQFFFNESISKFDQTKITNFLKKAMLCKIFPFSCVQLMDPKGGIILQDVSKICDLGIDPFEANNFIKNKDKYLEEINNYDNLIAINHNPNIYQKYAINAALNDNVLIYGPPGTGKSETIANLIANILLRNHNVLMCSEKKAALDVLNDRLGKLQNLSLSIYDTKNRKEFYEKISNLYDYIQECNLENLDELKNKINTNDYDKLRNIQKWYLLDNELLELKLSNDLISYLPLNQEHLNEILKSSDYEKLFNFQVNHGIINQDLSFEKISELINLSKTFINFYDKYLDIINKLWDKNLVISSTSAIEYLEFFKNIKPKYQHYSINVFINTLQHSKGSIFKSNVPKSYCVYDQNLLLQFLNDLVSLKIDALTKHNYLKTKSFLDNYSSITQQDVIFYNDIKKIKDVFQKYGYSNQIDINKQINDYYDDCEIKSNRNDELIFNWYINKIHQKIITFEKTQDPLSNDIKEVFRMSKLKRFPSIQKTLKRFYNAFKEIFPIWVMSPVEVSVNTPNQPKIFDYGIFDEASQMFVENSYAAVYRCNSICVAGDDKQLKPTNFFNAKFEVDESVAEQDTNYLIDSLFDKAKNSLWYEFYLRNHYRSQNAELIEFSNKYIYENSLETATKNGCFSQSIKVFDVPGIWDGECNEVEISSAIEYLSKNYTVQDFENKKTILIVTCNKTQKDEMLEQINKFATKQKGKFNYILDAIDNEIIKIRNIENVQGDEADITILLLTYGPTKANSKTIKQFFGPISQDGGKNRLNVAITRAKNELIVFKSITGDMLNFSENINNEVFRQFINYLDEIKNKPIDENNFGFEQGPKTLFESKLHKQFYDFVKHKIDDEKYFVLNNVKLGSKLIDIAIINKDTKKVELGIEFDDLKKHEKNFSDIFTNLDQQIFLKARGYKIIRVKELEWLNFPEKINVQIQPFFLTK